MNNKKYNLFLTIVYLMIKNYQTNPIPYFSYNCIFMLVLVDKNKLSQRHYEFQKTVRKRIF